MAMSEIASAIVMMFSVLVPGKLWYAPDQAVTFRIEPPQGGINLVLTDFLGREVQPQESTEVTEAGEVDLRKIYPQTLGRAGTHILYAVPRGGTGTANFVGTPIVIEVRIDRRRNAPPGPIVVRVEPLRYAVMTTNRGPMTMAFYYDVAPNTVANFLGLSEGGYYNGLTFHRVDKTFVIQGGDPRGDGAGGPGYSIPAEFNDRPHHEGVLSMARSNDPNSAGSQFFICLDYAKTRQLDGSYTAFGRVIEGMETVQAIAQTPVTGERPREPQIIEKVEVLPVTPDKNPYTKLQEQLQPPP
jgi:peptidyl-prolyl cis-trans isomerase B (cyclophilin B)